MSDDPNDFGITDPALCEIAEALGLAESFDMPTARTRFGNPQPRNIESYGLHDSGTPVDLKAVAPPREIQRVKVMTIALPMDLKNAGIATVQLSVVDASDHLLTVPTNQRVICDLEWQTGRGGGGAQIDATRGHVFSMVGGHVVNVYATLLSNRMDPVTGDLVPLVPGQDKHIEGVVQWGSTTFQPAYMSSPRIALTAATPSIPILIPPQAARLVVFNDTPLAVVTAELANADGTDVLYSADFNRTAGGANKVPVVAGAETLILTPTIGCTALAMWELWL